jgi:prepilin-type N-terminal cleavage/methylation domain-containing protein
MKKKSKHSSHAGFTFIEVMVTVAILGIVVAIALPAFMRSRKRGHMNTCIANLRQIHSAKVQASFARTDYNDPVILFGPSGYIKVTPVCPLTKGSYSVNEGDEFPTCPNASVDPEYPHVMPALNY